MKLIPKWQMISGTSITTYVSNFIHILWQENRGGATIGKSDTLKTYTTPNYNALGQKAYEYQYDSYHYTEYFDYFAPNDLIRFDSIS